MIDTPPIVGGFTSVAWKPSLVPDGGAAQDDPTAFLFNNRSNNSLRKFTVCPGESPYAVKYPWTSGPRFGRGPDLWLLGYPIRRGMGCVNFSYGHTFTLNGTNLIGKKQHAVDGNGGFSVDEVEIFAV